jgi:hypothetical protein
MTKKNTNIYICCSPNKPLRKSMRRNIPAFFAISILIILILFSACILQSSPDKNSTQNAGLAQVSEESPYISFDLARQNLAEYRPDPANGSSAIKTIYYIHGTNLDISGNALSWIFGVHYAGETELFAYDRSGWIRIPWNVPPFSREIDVEKIVSPGSLFSKNSAVILSESSPTNPERRDLELIQGIYTLSISGSQDRILMFNATTGEMIK